MNPVQFAGVVRSILPTRMLPSAVLGGTLGYPLYIVFMYVMANHYPDNDVSVVNGLAFICPCFLIVYGISVKIGIFGLGDLLQSHLDALGYVAKKANLSSDEYEQVFRRVMDEMVALTSPAYKASLRNQSSKPKGAE